MAMLSVAAMFITIISLILNVVGIAIPYWESEDIEGRTVNYGLWKKCGDVCVKFPDAAVTSEFKATRALVLLAMVELVVSLLCALLKCIVMKDREMLPKVSGICAIVAGVLMVAAEVVYALKVKGASTTYSACFAMTVVADVGSFVAGGLFIADKGQWTRV